MTTTKETEVTIGETEVTKVALTSQARTRLAFEALALTVFQDSPHIPAAKRYDATMGTLVSERVAGKSFKEVFAVNDEWHATAMPWAAVAPLLEQYVTAETDLLARGAMYRDLNLEHLIFTGDKAVLVDHEETVGNIEGEDQWYFKSIRGTWETMAPEEFRGYGYLTERTATYRAAVLAHLALSGELPFPRFPLRRDVHRSRKRRVAQIAGSLPQQSRRVLRVALDERSARRHASPEHFFKALKSTYEDTV